ncbi:glycosyltransferase [uncultured Selenomonas sp.]|uniref:glycosyltransferase n=1 Tax=uncultured Selenomonas sp. TaxID=159275 RepID=UPI00262198BB|nr:glycosyltransferase [uncultured Selenomonas sp.]
MAKEGYASADGAGKNMDAAGRGVSLNRAAGAAQTEEVLYTVKEDRRLLSHVPDATGKRSNRSRRGASAAMESDDYVLYEQDAKNGQRYLVDYPVKIESAAGTLAARAVDISTTGILVRLEEETRGAELSGEVKLTFEIEPGTMPEGYEMKVKKLPAKVVRSFGQEEKLYGIEFKKSLAQYAAARRQGYMFTLAIFFLAVITFIIVLMRAESVIYFKFNRWLYLYSIIAATFLLTRYLFAMFYRPVPIDPDYTPGVTIIVPCFDEEEWIQRTIHSCINQDYPVDKLEVIVVDDCSNDRSAERVQEMIAELKAADTNDSAYRVSERIRFLQQPQNLGKRDAMARGAKEAKHELLVFVDSDSFLDPFAVRNIVQPFKDKEMGGVSGRTDVANTYTNALTKMQAVRYSIAFRVMKAAEGYFDAATCLSGPLSCYRKDLVLKYMDAWLNQRFLGQKATFGDDRSMTNFILRRNRTTYQDSAVCMTIVPRSYSVFLRQQMRWKRSWLRESLIASRFMWKKEPFMSLGFYMGVLVPIAAPVVVIYNLLFVPIMHRVFPVSFVVGMLMMALLMSMAQLLIRRSTTWIYAMWFCVYYEAVLLWQMPVAWVTFWKTTWGTRMTLADIAALNKKKKKKEKEGRVILDKAAERVA